MAWYDRHGRDLPWRVKGARADPYRVWLSEIMLQQTTVAAVGPYYARFLERFPTITDLAAAPREAVLEAWAGLGYYSRARNLHFAARRLATAGLPQTEEGWRDFPGIGPYTAAAIAAIAHDLPANVVDGNVERVMSRLFAVETPLPAAKRALRAHALTLVGPDRPGDYAQALMDLGATICTPAAPKCDLCPWSAACAARAAGAPETYPRKTKKAKRPTRHGIAFRLERRGALWLVRRPEEGLLGAMPGLPTTPWRTRKWSRAEALTHAPLAADWRKLGAVRHVFTHFALTLEVWAAGANAGAEKGWWAETSAIETLPTVFRKAARLTASAAGTAGARRKRDAA